MPQDYYDLLGVSRDAEEREIKKAFRRLARELHPDVNRHDPDAEEKFKQAAEAYEVLSDRERRATYDRFGHEGLRSGGWAPRSTGFGSFEDVISAFFGAEGGLGDIFGGRRGPAAGGDIGLRVEIGLDEVLTGAQREVSFDAVSVCERCRGNGAEPGTPITTCENCGGSGELRQVARTAFGQMIRSSACPACDGDGRVAESPCEECNGKGRLVRSRTWDVEIPAGIESGQRIRIGGAGHAGEAGAPPGDLYVEVTVTEDPRFERHGSELATVVRVSAPRAMLGGSVEVPTLDGQREVEVPVGAQPGETVVLPGLGLPTLRGPGRGDQHVVLDVVVPAELSEEQRALAAELEAGLGPSNLEPERREARRRPWRRRRAG